MREELERLWYDYLIEIPMEYSKKEKDIINNWKENETAFRSALNKEQIKLLEEYDKFLSEVNGISEKNAFIKGIIFATKFIFQALQE